MLYSSGITLFVQLVRICEGLLQAVFGVVSKVILVFCTWMREVKCIRCVAELYRCRAAATHL